MKGKLKQTKNYVHNSSTEGNDNIHKSSMERNDNIHNSSMEDRDILVKLPQDLRDYICQKLDFVDYFACKKVSKAWREIAITAKGNKGFHLQKVPCLVSENDDLTMYTIPHGNKFTSLQAQLPSPEYCGSSWGWTVLHSIVFNAVFLVSPFSKLQIPLPSTEIIYPDDWIFKQGYRICKAIISSPPIDRKLKNSNCRVLLLASGNLFYCNMSNPTWIALEFFRNPSRFVLDYYSDIGNPSRDIFNYKGKFYAVTIDYDLTIIEIKPPLTIKRLNFTPLEINDSLRRERYFVESNGDLLMAVRIFQRGSDCTGSKFEIYKADFMKKCWLKVDSLGDQVLFVGAKCSFSLEFSNLPSTIEKNSIYFIIGDPWACFRAGVYNLKDCTVKPLPTRSGHWFQPYLV